MFDIVREETTEEIKLKRENRALKEKVEAMQRRISQYQLEKLVPKLPILQGKLTR